jgi:bifunctional UDP-N-acetylglucosamine pyrophosphorylase/glucosamine-1-phosphate N-acetyltransferase
MKGISAIILAAGQGRRMRSSLPKVAHLVLGKPVVWHVAGGAAKSARWSSSGYGRDKVLPVVEAFGGKVAIQESQFGTGDAARCGMAELSTGAKEVVVLCGDAPLIRPATIRALLAARRRQGTPASVLTGVLDDPAGYGRIVRGDDGAVARIVEEKDANAVLRKVREVNSGTYAFDRVFLERGLPRLT